MHPLRLAYTTQFLIASMTVYWVWSQVGGQGHLDLMTWQVKLALGLGAAFAIVKATAAAVEAPSVWNGGTLRWLGILLALAVGCGMATYYVHLYDEDTGDEEEAVSELSLTPRMIERYEAPVVRSGGCQCICPDLRRVRRS